MHQRRQALNGKLPRGAYGASHETANVRIPQDLLQALAPQTLADWVQAEVAELTAERWQFPCAPVGDMEKLGGLLSILSFAYATGLFASEGIARSCRSNSAIRLVSRGEVPHALDLSSFRRKHRGLLVTVLAHVLIRYLQEQLSAREALRGPASRRLVHENAVERLDIARHMDRADE